jgi:hypothetical protein
MSPIEMTMQGVGWVGMVLILIGMRRKNRTQRQVLIASGAALLAAMAFYPQLQPVFFWLQSAVALVGFINIKPHREKLTLPLIFLGAIISSYSAIQASVGPDTWLAVLGLVGIALGYSGTPEREGGNQSLWFGLGGTGMVGYSTFGVLAGVWQAWPFLILNIPFAYWGFRDTIRERKRRKKERG